MFTQLGAIKMDMNINSSRGGDQPLSITDCRCSSADQMVVDAVLAVKTYNDYGDARYPIKSINILKAHGKSVKESRVINGYALNMGRAAQGMVNAASPASVIFPSADAHARWPLTASADASFSDGSSAFVHACAWLNDWSAT